MWNGLHDENNDLREQPGNETGMLQIWVQEGMMKLFKATLCTFEEKENN